MPKTESPHLARYFSLPQQPYRAASLELDYSDPEVIGAYIPTAKSVAVLDQICGALQTDSRDRAIGVIAPYGSGKTSLLLFLCSLLETAQKTKTVLPALLHRVGRISPSTAQQARRLISHEKGYVVVPLSGYQGDLRTALARGLQEALAGSKLGLIWAKINVPETLSHLGILDLYRNAAREVIKSGYLGITVIYDEFGKVLEFQQGEARPEDLFLVQSFAELCSRSAKQRLLFIITLHQGFAQYAQRLPSHVRSEWAKIEGRFHIIHYIEDSLQVYELIGQALKKLQSKSFGSLKGDIARLAKQYVRASAAISCFASLKDKEDRCRIFSHTFPLHPLALYALPRLSARVSQNERTLFHFLLGKDQHCLYYLLANKEVMQGRPELVTLSDLYEYFSELMTSDTGVGGTYRRLIEIKAALDRADPANSLAIKVIKTIGLLSILGERLKAPVTPDLLGFALDAGTGDTRSELKQTLNSLVSRKILLHRRHSGEYRIWEGSDIDLGSVIRQKKAEVESILDPAAVVSSKIRAPIVFPHRYNEDFCITRVFEGQYVTAHDLNKLLPDLQENTWLRAVDGRILYVLADTAAEIEEATKLAQEITHPNVLISVPVRPLNLRDIVAEGYCIEQLLHDPAIISEDPVIRRELSELADDCLVSLRHTLARFQNLRAGETIWWHRGKAQEKVQDRVSLRRYVSECCGTVFSKTPRFNNEVINRRKPSATVVNARKKVLREVLTHYGSKEFKLTGYGPDVSMFRAVYLNTGLYHEAEKGAWRFALPGEIQDRNLRGVITEIHDFFSSAQDAPRSITDLVERLTLPPFGLRDGVLSLLLAAGLKSFPFPVSLMDQGVYVKELRAELFEQMVLPKNQLTVQCVALPEHVVNYLEGIQNVFSVNGSYRGKENDPLRETVVAVYRWVHQLSPCCLASEQVSQEAHHLRTLLLKAMDPVHLLFVELPKIALKLEGSGPDQLWMQDVAYGQVLQGVKGLRCEIDAVMSNYLNHVALATRKTFGLPEGGMPGLRDDLRKWISSCEPDLRDYVEDTQCSGMLERVRSEYETDMKLAESLASLVTGKSLAHWNDSYLRQYELGLLSLQGKLAHTNALLVKRNNNGDDRSIKKRIADPVLWERLEVLDLETREMLAFHLLTTVREGSPDGRS